MSVFCISTARILVSLILIVTSVFVNSLCNVLRCTKLEFHTTMLCICVQFYRSKVLRSETSNSTTTKIEFFVARLSSVRSGQKGLYPCSMLCLSSVGVVGSLNYSKLLLLIQLIAYSFCDYLLLLYIHVLKIIYIWYDNLLYLRYFWFSALDQINYYVCNFGFYISRIEAFIDFAAIVVRLVKL